jgi:hypothetical protein
MGASFLVATMLREELGRERQVYVSCFEARVYECRE